ncbi:hypothetical protein ACHAW6_002873 [Cyclotella cf. meneghiniana]
MLHPSLLESIFRRGENYPMKMTVADDPSSVLKTSLHIKNFALNISLGRLPFVASLVAAVFVFIVILLTYRIFAEDISKDKLTAETMAYSSASSISTVVSLQTVDESIDGPIPYSALEENEVNKTDLKTHHDSFTDSNGNEATTNTSSAINELVEDRMSVTTTAPSSYLSSTDSLHSIDESEDGLVKENVLIHVCDRDDVNETVLTTNQADLEEKKVANTTLDLSSVSQKCTEESEDVSFAKKEVKADVKARMNRLPVYDEDDAYDADEPFDLDDMSRATLVQSSLPVSPDMTYLPRKLSSKISGKRKYVRVASSGASVSSEITMN